MVMMISARTTARSALATCDRVRWAVSRHEGSTSAAVPATMKTSKMVARMSGVAIGSGTPGWAPKGSPTVRVTSHVPTTKPLTSSPRAASRLCGRLANITAQASWNTATITKKRPDKMPSAK
jgi:hypothetical protein